MLYNRISVALANLKNLGRVGDVDEILRSQAENDEAALETSYSVVAGFVWAIPVLGFIGTVQGLSSSIGEFGGVLQSAENFDVVTSKLRSVTAGLTMSFETTLVALVAALCIQLLLTFMKKSEQEFLDECTRYCVCWLCNHPRTDQSRPRWRRGYGYSLTNASPTVSRQRVSCHSTAAALIVPNPQFSWVAISFTSRSCCHGSIFSLIKRLAARC
ncbi:hypothetical protein PLANPX_4213 [Lacipirellula parvula]|uniref:MotA/TolQ/ExbB proton channel domain-containing protein n=1 Tax=Lacipirellula parvula TaxID=2650471 RepID=A0A5K7XI16_9BACT|nr:MotA/TolQ/ExbB proton channel family protein [Lacipirellula parvula]BBO34601.1 hypothetical protein PLANPX_4213 [Lacipirellula parvula]